MYRVVKAASFGGYKYRYEVHWMTPEGSDKLLGGSRELAGAEKIALNQLDSIYENPWETPQRKALFIENCYIWDSENDVEVTTDAVVDKEDALLGMLS